MSAVSGTVTAMMLHTTLVNAVDAQASLGQGNREIVCVWSMQCMNGTGCALNVCYTTYAGQRLCDVRA